MKRVDEDELDDLQTSDVLLPPDLLLQAGQEVVVIPVCVHTGRGQHRVRRDIT